ncbi:hypothetical protein TNCV_4036571 [Trichonephila clavipes]|nr:hypothetical protein TNCV_4036571 [Trichonephila clavipes]
MAFLGTNGVTENIRNPLQSQFLDPKSNLTKDSKTITFRPPWCRGCSGVLLTGYFGRAILLTKHLNLVRVSDRGWHVTSSRPVPLKIRRVEQRCTLNLSRAETSSRWCGGVVVRRRGDSSGVVLVT